MQFKVAHFWIQFPTQIRFLFFILIKTIIKIIILIIRMFNTKLHFSCSCNARKRNRRYIRTCVYHSTVYDFYLFKINVEWDFKVCKLFLFFLKLAICFIRRNEILAEIQLSKITSSVYFCYFFKNWFPLFV